MTDDLDYTLSCLRRSVEEDFAWTLYPAGSAVLLAEVERLRAEVALLQQEARIRQAINDGLAAEVAHLRACVPPTRPSDYGHEAWAETVRAEVAAERAVVVAWLRTQRLYCTDSTGTPNAVSATYAHAAEAIERGEHRREEER